MLRHFELAGKNLFPVVRYSTILFVILAAGANSVVAQMETATLSGTVMDQSGAAIPDSQVEVTNSDTNITVTTTTNKAGLYVVPALKPGRYRVQIVKQGFKQIVLTDLVLNVQDVVSRNFNLQVGAVSESISVAADAEKINASDATVSTVIDRNFAENLPMNGRSFQTLIELTPGVVLTTSNPNDAGQFSVNGQRADSNYWTVDGVSANISAQSSFGGGNGFTGGLPALSVQGGTNSLVSVDALQEFRIQTSTYAPEFGRTPGGQISISTRSGTNQFHGSLFEFLRNDVLDANDWFADHENLLKPKERENDFGGTFSGPILKNRTFFFFSYEGQRLRLPEVAESIVPDLAARLAAQPSIQPYLSAYPLPNGVDNMAAETAGFNASFSNSSTLNSYSIRIDHKLRDKLTVFGRYNRAPSRLIQRGFSDESLSDVTPTDVNLQTATVGSMWLITPFIANDLRVNYSWIEGASRSISDGFGGAIPLTLPALPSPNTFENSEFGFQFAGLQSSHSSLVIGKIQRNVQRQVNVVDSLSIQKGPHSLKFGVDFRRLSPSFDPQLYGQFAIFADVPSAAAGNLEFAQVRAGRGTRLVLHNLSLFGQDTWRMGTRVIVTYGLRWDVDFAPSAADGPNLLAVTGFDLKDLSNLALAPAGTPPFHTPYGGFAPRVGLAYRLTDSQSWQNVLRGGVGLFYDLATQQVGNNIGAGTYPFGATNFIIGGSFPLPPGTAMPPPILPSELQSDVLSAFDPHLKLPYTLQWNGAFEQSWGKQQSVSLSYIGAAGRRLIQTAFVVAPNPSFGLASLVSNAARSDYDALQVQFRRALTGGLQALSSYTWSHSIDTASAGSAFGLAANTLIPGNNPNANKGSSDYDVRHAFSLGLTYDVPSTNRFKYVAQLFQGWSIHNLLQARSALPVTVYDGAFFELRNAAALIFPDVVPGQPLYLRGSECIAVFGMSCPGGKGFNPLAFTAPPSDSNGIPLRQGNLGRNALGGFGAVQWDVGVQRAFAIHESLKLEFRAEMFNVLNHPNFGPPVADINNPSEFGRSVQMLGRSLNFENSGGGGLSPLYQIGGPRSIQLALKLEF
jgi:hypothetical protein